jgi:hypothetical protein
MAQSRSRSKWFPTWDAVTLSGVYLEDGRRARSLWSHFRINEVLNLASHLTNMDDDVANISGETQYKNRPWTDIVSLSLLPILELATLVLGAAIVSAYTWAREKRENPENNIGEKIFFGGLQIIVGAANLIIAQPLFFVSRALFHVRQVVDGVLNFGLGILTGIATKVHGLITGGDSTKCWTRAKQGWSQGWKGIGLCAIDGVCAGIAYGLSFIPGLQPFAFPFATAIQAASSGTLTAVSGLTVVQTGVALTTSGLGIAGASNLFSRIAEGVSNLFASSLTRKVRKASAEFKAVKDAEAARAAEAAKSDDRSAKQSSPRQVKKLLVAARQRELSLSGSFVSEDEQEQQREQEQEQQQQEQQQEQEQQQDQQASNTGSKQGEDGSLPAPGRNSIYAVAPSEASMLGTGQERRFSRSQ